MFKEDRRAIAHVVNILDGMDEWSYGDMFEEGCRPGEAVRHLKRMLEVLEMWDTNKKGAK